GQAVGHFADVMFQLFRRDAVDGTGDAEHGAKEAENRDGPGDETDEGVAVLQGGRVAVSQVAQVVVQLGGRAAAGQEVEDARYPVDEPAFLHRPRQATDVGQQLRRLGDSNGPAFPRREHRGAERQAFADVLPDLGEQATAGETEHDDFHLLDGVRKVV